MDFYFSNDNIIGEQYFAFLEYYYNKANIVTFQIESYTEELVDENLLLSLYKEIIEPLSIYKNSNEYIEKVRSNEKKYLFEINLINQELMNNQSDLIRIYFDEQYIDTVYEKKSKIFVFKFTENILNYLKTANSLFDWCKNRPSDLTFFKDENCLVTSTAHENFFKVFFKNIEEIEELSFYKGCKFYNN